MIMKPRGHKPAHLHCIASLLLTFIGVYSTSRISCRIRSQHDGHVANVLWTWRLQLQNDYVGFFEHIGDDLNN